MKTTHFFDSPLMKAGFLAFISAVSSPVGATTAKSAQLKLLPVNEKALQEDLSVILKKAKLPTDSIQFNLSTADVNKVKIQCTPEGVYLDVYAMEAEQTSTLYKGIRELGFLFPHPQKQISPTLSDMRKQCEREVTWEPTIAVRGFHLHTLHPSEWVHGFFMNKKEVAIDTIRWMARNGQNALDVILLRLPLPEISRQMKPLFELAQELQIYTGISVGIATQQQKTYRLLDLWESTVGWNSDRKIVKGLDDLARALPLSFLTLEVGTSEFTATKFEKTLDWFNLAAETCRKNEVSLFTKVHVSSNQYDPVYGNFNFLAQYATPELGIWPHTVMFYGLLDKKAPMYGNENFSGITEFMQQQKAKRPTWYYPETSYWIGMDADIPLFLTDYLRTRAEDYAWVSKKGFEGHMNFTTGHAMGGWLWDWGLALMTDKDYNFDPLTALRLLGEDVGLWKEHLDFQDKWFKQKGLIALLSAANLQDELSSHRIHDRFTMKELSTNPERVEIEIGLLEESLPLWPSIDEIKDHELKEMLRITKMRHEHALEIRKAFRGDRELHISKAKVLRLGVQELIADLAKLPNNYPLLPLFKRHKNPTSYQFGYVYLASSTYFWEREERQVSEQDFWPFKGNIINLLDLFL